MKLGRTFFSLYFLIVSTFIIFSWLLDEVWSSYLEQDIESYTGYKIMLSAISDYLEQHPQQEWQVIVARLSKKYQLPLAIISENKLQNLAHAKALHQGNTHVYYHNNAVYLHYLIEGSHMVLALGPAKMPTRPRIESLLRMLILAALALVIFIWVWPMSRDLDVLKKATISFGKGEFNTQAPIAKSASISPMINAFNMMAKRIKMLITAHKELTSAVSHELRTPLARTKFALQMLSTIQDNAKREKYLQQIHNDVNELDELINEMLIYATFDSDRPKLAFKLVKIVDTVEIAITQHSQYQGSITIDNQVGELLVECDPHFIQRALSNYIINASKYGKDHIHICLVRDNDYCVIRVEDNGDGVEQDFKATIFDVFSRGDQSRNRETGGFGLGLAIVSRIMEWHNGYVDLQESELGGAAFILAWPIKQIK